MIPQGYRKPSQVYSRFGYDGAYLPSMVGGRPAVMQDSARAIPNPIPGLNPIGWMNGDLQAYSDIAGTIPVVVGGRVGRINEEFPLTSNWQAPSNSQRPSRNSNSINVNYFGSAEPAQQIFRPAITTAPGNSFSMILSFVPRDGSGGPVNGLLRIPAPTIGLSGAGSIAVNYNNGSQWAPTPQYTRNTKTTIGVVWSPSGIRFFLLTDAGLQTDSLATVVNANPLNNGTVIGDNFGGTQGMYAAVSQAVTFGTSLSDANILSAMAWTHSRPLPAGYPLDAPLFGLMGDSIIRGTVGVVPHDAYCWIALNNLKSVYPAAEMCNVAVVGSGAGVAGFTPLAPFYSASRARNVALVAVGTNDLATGVTAATMLTNLYAQCAAAKVQGWRLAISTILPRSGLLTVSQATFDAQALIANSDIIANWPAHADALVNTTAIVGMGAPGDSNNATNYQVDKVHPTPAGMLLLEPSYRAALQGLAA